MSETSFGTKVKNLLTLPAEAGKWHIELNVMDWGKGNQYDLRRWSDDGRMSKGLTLTREEVLELFKNIKEEDLV